MQNKKSVTVFAILLTSFLVLPVVFSCNNSAENKSTSDSATVQPAPMDTSTMQTDTTALDTASTRPVKSPN